MKTFISAAVTLEDLKTFFKHGGETPVKSGTESERWRSRAKDDDSGGFIAESPSYEVDLSPGGTVFHVHIEAVDDSSDSDEAVTDDPSGFIADFLKTGSAGDEVFGKMAGLIRRSSQFSPQDTSNILRYVASEIEAKKYTRSAAVKAVRRISVLMDIDGIQQAFNRIARVAADLNAEKAQVESSALKKLMSTLEGKGWKTEIGENDAGTAQITVDINGIYVATITVDHVSWKFSFQITGVDSTKVEGTTDDPIQEFESFAKDPDVVAARKKAVSDRSKKSQDQAEQATVPPPKKRS